ncbi:MAG: DUF3079 domain-containing protein, partial [Comamonadaceae bacterium]
LQCGNGSERTQHPVELFGDDWAQWGLDKAEPVSEFGPEPSESSSLPKRP